MAPEWMGSEGVWFLALNAVVVAIAFLSRARPSRPPASPRRGGITRRTSSAVLNRLRSFSIFSYPSASCLSSFLLPDAAATSRDTEEPVATSPINNKAPPTPSALVLLLTSSPPAAEYAPAAEEEEEEEDDPNAAMSMDEAYALIVAARQRPEHEGEEEARRRSEVDAKAEEEFVRGFKDDVRQQRLDSIFNYTQMLKQRAQGASRR